MTVARLRALLAEMPDDLEVRLDDSGNGRLYRVEVGEVFPVDMDSGEWGKPQQVVFLYGDEGEVDAEPVASLLVLYVSDLAESRRFYELLGFTFVREQHGDGPVHYSAELPGGLILRAVSGADRRREPGAARAHSVGPARSGRPAAHRGVHGEAVELGRGPGREQSRPQSASASAMSRSISLRGTSTRAPIRTTRMRPWARSRYICVREIRSSSAASRSVSRLRGAVITQGLAHWPSAQLRTAQSPDKGSGCAR